MSKNVLTIEDNVKYIIFKTNGSGGYDFYNVFTGPGSLTRHFEEKGLDPLEFKIFKETKIDFNF